MQLDLGKCYLTVTRDAGDKKFYGVKCARGENQFLHHLMKELNKKYALGLVKRHIQADGHLAGNRYQCYLRSSNVKKGEEGLYIFNPLFAIKGLEKDWNKHGFVALAVQRWTNE